ncbi:MAG: hypothetical protein ACFFDN_37400 [Candidatus Hodarchaeota archaeon]
MASKTKSSKIGVHPPPHPMLADITELETRDTHGNFANFFKSGDIIILHVHLIYPEEIADVQGEYNLNIYCREIAPNLQSFAAYSKSITDKLIPNTTDFNLDIDFTAVSPGAQPGVYMYLATFDFGPASDFGAWLYSNAFFVF